MSIPQLHTQAILLLLLPVQLHTTLLLEQLQQPTGSMCQVKCTLLCSLGTM